jgi:hypothetical protein
MTQRWRVTGPFDEVVEFTVDEPFDLCHPETFDRVAALARLTKRVSGVQQIEVERDGVWSPLIPAPRSGT